METPKNLKSYRLYSEDLTKLTESWLRGELERLEGKDNTVKGDENIMRHGLILGELERRGVVKSVAIQGNSNEQNAKEIKNKMAQMDYRQIRQLKEQYKDCILLVRIGDFYEMYGDDAVTVSKELDLTLTGRDMAGAAERVPMTGVPFHSADNYISKLIEKGYRIAVAENLEPLAQERHKELKGTQAEMFGGRGYLYNNRSEFTNEEKAELERRYPDTKFVGWDIDSGARKGKFFIRLDYIAAEKGLEPDAPAQTETPETLSSNKERQKKFLDDNNAEPMVGIYQLKDKNSLREYRFIDLETLNSSGKKVDSDNYNLVYAEPMKNHRYMFDDIYRRFNTDLPADFRGHSLSISDVVVLKYGDGRCSAYYVDSSYFPYLNDFRIHELSRYKVKQERKIKGNKFGMEDGYGYLYSSRSEFTDKEKNEIIRQNPDKILVEKDIDSGVYQGSFFVRLDNVVKILEPETTAQTETQKQDADTDEEDYFDKWARATIEIALKDIPENNRIDYLTARLIAVNAFSDIVNKDMSYFDASYVDPISDRLYSEKILLKDMLSKTTGAENRATQGQYLKEIAERFSREISVLEEYGWTRNDVYRNIIEKSIADYLDEIVAEDMGLSPLGAQARRRNALLQENERPTKADADANGAEQLVKTLTEIGNHINGTMDYAEEQKSFNTLKTATARYDLNIFHGNGDRDFEPCALWLEHDMSDYHGKRDYKGVYTLSLDSATGSIIKSWTRENLDAVGLLKDEVRQAAEDYRLSIINFNKRTDSAEQSQAAPSNVRDIHAEIRLENFYDEHYDFLSKAQPTDYDTMTDDEKTVYRKYIDLKDKANDLTEAEKPLVDKFFSSPYYRNTEYAPVGAAKGLMIKSQVDGWLDWSTETLPTDVRAAAEWLIQNGYENETAVKNAFYYRQTSSMSDDRNAESQDNAAIISVAETYKSKLIESKAEPEQERKTVLPNEPVKPQTDTTKREIYKPKQANVDIPQNLKNYLKHEFSSGSSTGKDYLTFQRIYINYLRKLAAANDWELARALKGHYNFSAFFKNGAGKFVYMSIGDVRGSNDWYNNILVRTAKHDKDYTGGANNHVPLTELAAKMRELFGEAMSAAAAAAASIILSEKTNEPQKHNNGNLHVCRNIANEYWGEVQTERTLVNGVYDFSTAGHGGYVVDGNVFNLDKIPEKFFADKHKKFAVFEEDCDWAVLFYHYPAVSEEFYRQAAKTHDKGFYEKYPKHDSFFKDCVIGTMESYHKELLAKEFQSNFEFNDKRYPTTDAGFEDLTGDFSRMLAVKLIDDGLIIGNIGNEKEIASMIAADTKKYIKDIRNFNPYLHSYRAGSDRYGKAFTFAETALESIKTVFYGLDETENFREARTIFANNMQKLLDTVDAAIIRPTEKKSETAQEENLLKKVLDTLSNVENTQDDYNTNIIVNKLRNNMNKQDLLELTEWYKSYLAEKRITEMYLDYKPPFAIPKRFFDKITAALGETPKTEVPPEAAQNIKNVMEDKKMENTENKTQKQAEYDANFNAPENYNDDPLFGNGAADEKADAGNAGAERKPRLTPEDYIRRADADFLKAMREGRYAEIIDGIADLNYSARNVMLIKSQMPNATKVMGMHAWNYQGRSVIGGQTSLKILAVTDNKAAAERGADSGENGSENGENGASGKNYYMNYVFDVSQTKGKELKGKPCTPEALDKYFEGIKKTIAGMAQGYTFVESEKNSVNFDERVISVKSGLSREEQLKAMIYGVARVRTESKQREDGGEISQGRGLFNVIEETAVTHIAARRLGLGDYPLKTADFAQFDDESIMRMSANLHYIKMGAQRITNAVDRYLSGAQSADALRTAREATAASMPIMSPSTRAASVAEYNRANQAAQPSVIQVQGYYPIFNANAPAANKKAVEAGG